MEIIFQFLTNITPLKGYACFTFLIALILGELIQRQKTKHKQQPGFRILAIWIQIFLYLQAATALVWAIIDQLQEK